MKIIDLGRLWRSLTSSTVGYTSDAGLLVVYDIIATLNAAEASCERAGPSRATVEPGETFSWGPQTFLRGPSREKFFEFLWKWCFLVYFIFLSDGGAPKRRGARGSLPLPPTPPSRRACERATASGENKWNALDDIINSKRHSSRSCRPYIHLM